MKITLENTSKVVTLNTPDGSVPARIWEGQTEDGIAVHAFITRIAVNKTDDATAFERDLLATREPSPMVDDAYPSSLVL
jgi:hypothetical protein